MAATIDMNHPSHAVNGKYLFGHPVGLYFLFFTELWERFSYYGMRAILVLFIVDSIQTGGLGWTNGEALALYGWYTMSVYLATIPGGIIADRLLGQKKTVLIGGLLLCAGHIVLAVHAMWAFYAGLTLIVLGVGGLKSTISTMVGGLYRQGDPNRDRGFTIFYIGINIGAFAAGIAVASVAAVWGWHYGFGLAGLGMIVGQVMYLFGQRYLVGVGDYKEPEKVEGSTKEKPLTKIEKDRVSVLLISFLIVIVFWGAFEQAGGLMNLYAQQKTDRMLMGFQIPAGWFQSLNPAFIIIFGTIVSGFWFWWYKKGKESSSIFKMAIGTAIMGTGFFFMTAAVAQSDASASGLASMHWLVLAYLFHTLGELCVSPVALSFITKLAPVKYASIMMGIYFACTGLGNKLAGLLGEAAQSLGEYAVFTGIGVFSILFGLLLWAFLGKLKKLTHGAEDLHPEDEVKPEAEPELA
jgi:POT family proton-dependent oligopeptide transporter